MTNRSTEAVTVAAAVRFCPAIVLSKVEAFEACEACAEAERALLRSGRPEEAGRLAELFALLEGRLSGHGGPTASPLSPTESPRARSRETAS